MEKIDDDFDRYVFGIGTVRIKQTPIGELSNITVRFPLIAFKDTYFKYENKFVHVPGFPTTSFEFIMNDLKQEQLPEHHLTKKVASLAVKQELVLQKLEGNPNLTDLYVLDDHFCKVMTEGDVSVPVLFKCTTCLGIHGEPIQKLVTQRERFRQTLGERRLHLVWLSSVHVSVEVITYAQLYKFDQVYDYSGIHAAMHPSGT